MARQCRPLPVNAATSDGVPCGFTSNFLYAQRREDAAQVISLPLPGLRGSRRTTAAGMADRRGPLDVG